jgi:hypothetical protein
VGTNYQTTEDVYVSIAACLSPASTPQNHISLNAGERFESKSFAASGGDWCRCALTQRGIMKCERLIQWRYIDKKVDTHTHSGDISKTQRRQLIIRSVFTLRVSERAPAKQSRSQERRPSIILCSSAAQHEAERVLCWRTMNNLSTAFSAGTP